MRRRLTLTATLALLLAASSARSQPHFEVDVLVYGGTSAGVISAYTAKMDGKSVLLVEPGRHLGGMTSGGLGQTDIGNKFAITGLALELYHGTNWLEPVREQHTGSIDGPATYGSCVAGIWRR